MGNLKDNPVIIAKEGYAIIANKETGKIVLMIMTRKAKIINFILAHDSISIF